MWQNSWKLEGGLPYFTCIQLYRYRTGTVLVPVAPYRLVQYEAPTQAVRAIRGRVVRTGRNRLAYVRSRCGGRAIEHLLARSRPTSVNPYRDASEIFDHLKTILYQDVNRAWNAKGKLRRLYMRASDKFQDFVSESSLSGRKSSTINFM